MSKGKQKQNTHFYQLFKEEIFEPRMLNYQNKTNDDIFQCFDIEKGELGTGSWIFAKGHTETIIKKIDKIGKPLGQVLIVGQGMQTGRNKLFGKLENEIIEKWNLKNDQCFIRAKNSDIQRYYINNSKEIVLYLEEETTFNNLPIDVQNHLRSHEVELKERAAYKRGDCEWWKFTWPLHKELWNRKKLLCPYLAKKNRFALDKDNKYLGLTDTTVLFDNNQTKDICYIMGLLNSKLLTFRFKFIGKLKSNGIYEYFWNSISKIPIRTIDFSNKSDKARHDKMVELVERMLELNRKLAAASTAHEQTLLSRQVEATDKQIDRLVYELYDLTNEEIAIVEEATK